MAQTPTISTTQKELIQQQPSDAAHQAQTLSSAEPSPQKLLIVLKLFHEKLAQVAVRQQSAPAPEPAVRYSTRERKPKKRLVEELSASSEPAKKKAKSSPPPKKKAVGSAKPAPRSRAKKDPVYVGPYEALGNTQQAYELSMMEIGAVTALVKLMKERKREKEEREEKEETLSVDSEATLPLEDDWEATLPLEK